MKGRIAKTNRPSKGARITGKPWILSQGNLIEDKKCGKILWVPKEEVRGE
jgi:hypothetical protein